ncbi:hypothetical protein SEUCBS139899_003018 [Sporothrix eucalyptigena]|uniref:CENP-V/GFA domain-containing protein n=1 Tax=Sporothrix eucalyptigena TaxID=1812306 RepID=A0ABP0CYF2_9PEZI
MPSGSCICGEVAYEFAGNPVTTAVCHCTDCQKWGGSGFSTNLAVPNDALKINKGALSTFARKGSSGKDHILSFCGTCGTSLFSEPLSLGGVTLIKTGTLDDVAVRDFGVANELFVKDRLSFATAVAGATQLRLDLGGPEA